MNKHALSALILLLSTIAAHATDVHIVGQCDPVVGIARQMLIDDLATIDDNPYSNIVVYELDHATATELSEMQRLSINTDTLSTLIDGFAIVPLGDTVVVVGRNGRGAAYGLLELSRMAGVNPWTWWGDVGPNAEMRRPIEATIIKGASIEYRGIFINDEDWSLRAWAGGITKEMYRRVFELLLRLRANAIWPAMHEGSKAFFIIDGAKALADSFGIAVGTSHCEPLLRNNVAEWSVEERGSYNYITNRDAVQTYWVERLQEVSGSVGGNMFTIGMRGIHDGSMEGVKTMEEKVVALQQVIDDQQELIRTNIGDPVRQMQVFVPYKEVLQIYEQGLKVPDYVTLMWCDDNYGYLTRLSTPEEQQRSGGAGVYYHLSYWGRPHDYLWLTTTQPGLIYNEMREAYDHNARKLWIANVHDPKVAGYDLELFLDMAWDIDCVTAATVGDHYRAWLCRQFGTDVGEAIYPAMRQWFRQCGRRRPEFMGWSQVELDKKKYNRGLSPIQDTEFSQSEFGGELQRYLSDYERICIAVENAKLSLPNELADAYFAAIEYPVKASASHARKCLSLQRSDTLAAYRAYCMVDSLTREYNALADGKWKGIMSANPRNLPVFGCPEISDELKENGREIPLYYTGLETHHYTARDAADYDSCRGKPEVVDMLGHSMRALRLPKGASVTYNIDSQPSGTSAQLYVALIPTQPSDNGDLRVEVSINGKPQTVISLKEPFRSEQWKKNVLRGQALKVIPINIPKHSFTLTIKAIDDHILLDQWMIDTDPDRQFYIIPTH